MIYYKSETDYLAAYHRGEILLETTRQADGAPVVELPACGPALRVVGVQTTSRPDWRGGALPYRSEIWLASADGSLWRAVVGRKPCGRYARIRQVARAQKILSKKFGCSLDISQE